MIGPAVSVGFEMMAAAVIAAVDQDISMPEARISPKLILWGGRHRCGLALFRKPVSSPGPQTRNGCLVSTSNRPLSTAANASTAKE
jgi:hypothetical protein